MPRTALPRHELQSTEYTNYSISPEQGREGGREEGEVGSPPIKFDWRVLPELLPLWIHLGVPRDPRKEKRRMHTLSALFTPPPTCDGDGEAVDEVLTHSVEYSI